MKILVMMPSYGKTNSDYMKQIMTNLDGVTDHELHYIVYTTEEVVFPNPNVVIKKYDKSIGRSLTHEYKNDLLKNVNDFVKQNKNHRCENFTISDLYDQDMVAKEKHKAEELEKRYL
jgi:hypothetical protein